jgi:ankyrin repeat protein
MAAAHAGKAEAVKLLLDHGAEVNRAEGRMGQTALMWAAAGGHTAAAQALIARGANVNAASKTGFTSLLFAAQAGDAECVKTLIAAKADPHFKSPDGAGAFALALARGHEDVARLMLDYGVDVNQRDRNGSTPLHEAVRLEKAGLVRDLVSRGANLEARTAAPTGPLARFRAGELTPFLTAAETGSVEMMKLLVELGADPKAKNPDGVGPVLLAAASRKLPALKYVVETLGGDVNETRRGAGSALHTAVRFGANEMIQLLVERGADLNVKDRFGRTPMEAAVFEAPKPTVALLKKLTEEKASQSPPRAQN